MYYATPVQPKIGTDKIIQRYTHSTWFVYTLRKWFQMFTPWQLEIFAKISSNTSPTQPDFYYINKIWFQDSTPAQPEIFVDDMVDTTLAHPGFHNICRISAKISLYTTLAQPDFYYINKIWFQDSTLTQPEIFISRVRWLISPCTPKP